MLFTDIEGSSDSVRALGPDRWESVLERHAAIIRDALDTYAGFMVRSEGDSFFAVFTSPSEAVAAVAEMQGPLHRNARAHQACGRGRVGTSRGEARAPGRGIGVGHYWFERDPGAALGSLVAV